MSPMVAMRSTLAREDEVTPRRAASSGLGRTTSSGPAGEGVGRMSVSIGRPRISRISSYWVRASESPS